MAPITVTGTNSGDVTPTVINGGFIKVQNNGAHVTATVSGTGTINVANNGQALTATNNGNGNITVNATSSAPITLTYTDGANHTFPKKNATA